MCWAFTRVTALDRGASRLPTLSSLSDDRYVLIRPWPPTGFSLDLELRNPATCLCISGTDVLRQFYHPLHWDRSGRSNFLPNPVTVYGHQADQFQRWPYNARRLAGWPLKCQLFSPCWAQHGRLFTSCRAGLVWLWTSREHTGLFAQLL